MNLRIADKIMKRYYSGRYSKYQLLRAYRRVQRYMYNDPWLKED